MEGAEHNFVDNALFLQNGVENIYTLFAQIVAVFDFDNIFIFSVALLNQIIKNIVKLQNFEFFGNFIFA